MKKSKFGLDAIRWSIPIAGFFLSGCSPLPLLAPKGPIGEAERFVILASFSLMLIVVIPVFIMIVWFPWKYRATNPNAAYRPKWSYSKKIDLTIWLVPVAVTTILGVLSWVSAHRLDPYKPIAPEVKPIAIQAVALDWKWLFVYPDYGVASVNRLVFPAGAPLRFAITSDSVMASFFIPPLGSQIYAMAGRRTRLNLMADQPGTYHGHNQQFSGKGYADMHFQALATSSEQFSAWLREAGRSADKLDLKRYEELAEPSTAYPATLFSSVAPGLFDHILGKYRTAEGKADAGEPRSAAGSGPKAALEGK